MKTDPSNVSVNVLHWIFWRTVQLLSQSVIHSVQEWTWFGERSDSVVVSVSTSISMTNSLDTGFPVLVFDISPDFRTWEDHLSSLFHSEEFDELTSITGFPCLFAAHLTISDVLSDFQVWWFRFFRCSRGKHGRTPYTASRYQIRHRLWFCCDSFFTYIFLCSFRHRFGAVHGAGMAIVEQTQKMIPSITCEISLC